MRQHDVKDLYTSILKQCTTEDQFRCHVGLPRGKYIYTRIFNSRFPSNCVGYECNIFIFKLIQVHEEQLSWTQTLKIFPVHS